MPQSIGRCAFVLCVALTITAPVAVAAQSISQTPPPGPSGQPPASNAGVVRFLESTNVFLSNQKDLRFEAHLFPHLGIWNNFEEVFKLDAATVCGEDQAHPLDGRAEGRKVYFALSGTPAVRLRMFNEVSRPVRTPSYMPRLNMQLILAPKFVENLKCVSKIIEDAKRTGRTLTSRGDSVTHTFLIREFHAIVGHHSNGQDGCLYTNQQRDGSECVDTQVGAREINKKDGSFSTNYIRVGSNFRWTRVDVTGTPRLDRTVRAELQWHPKALTSSKIEDQYGRLRLTVGGAYATQWSRVCQRSVAVSADAEWITFGRPETVDPVAFSVTASCHPTVSGGWGAFTRFYRGQDYYNLGFRENITQLQFGATYTTDSFFAFRR